MDSLYVLDLYFKHLHTIAHIHSWATLYPHFPNYDLIVAMQAQSLILDLRLDFFACNCYGYFHSTHGILGFPSFIALSYCLSA